MNNNKVQKEKVTLMETDQPKKSCLGKIMAFGGLMLSGVYLLNFTVGVIEIPDNLPLIGNLDEVFFSGMFFSCMGYLGWSLPFQKKK